MYITNYIIHIYHCLIIDHMSIVDVCTWQISTQAAASMWHPTMGYSEMETVVEIKTLSVKWKKDKTFPQKQLQLPILQQQQHQLQQLQVLGLSVTVERCREGRGSLVALILRRMSTLGRWEFKHRETLLTCLTKLMTRSGLSTLGRRCHGVVERWYPSSMYWQQRIAREVTFRQQSRFLLENTTHPMQSPTEDLSPTSPSTPTTTTQLPTWTCPSSPWPTPSTSPPRRPPSVCLHLTSLCTSTRRLRWLAGEIPPTRGHHPQYYKKLMLLPWLIHNAEILMAAKFRSMYAYNQNQIRLIKQINK